MVVFFYNFYIFWRFSVVCSLTYLYVSFQMLHFFLSNKELLALVFYQFETMGLLCSDSEKKAPGGIRQKFSSRKIGDRI